MDLEISKFIEDRIARFNEARLEKLRSCNLRKLIRKKNPYLPQAKSVHRFQDLSESMLDAMISSSEETLFGEALEDIAGFVAAKYRNAWKSSAEGIDLEFDLGDTRCVVAVKSGPNWANSQQIKRMIQNFDAVERILKQYGRVSSIRRINGCCYGHEASPFKSGYEKLCGQVFWELITGDPDFYITIIEPIVKAGKSRDKDFVSSYNKVVNQITTEIGNEYGDAGEINWERITRECCAAI